MNDGHYKSLKSFLSDFRWIILNCIPPRDEPGKFDHSLYTLQEPLIFYSFSLCLNVEIGLLSKAKLLEQICLHEVELLRACPTCYLNRINHVSTLPSTSFVFSPISRCAPHIYGRSMMKTTPSEPPQSSWFCKICVSCILVLFNSGVLMYELMSRFHVTKITNASLDLALVSDVSLID